MSKNLDDYRQGDTIYILLKKSQAESVMDEWLEGNWQSDMTYTAAKRQRDVWCWRPPT